jgi:hypothetical protein
MFSNTAMRTPMSQLMKVLGLNLQYSRLEYVIHSRQDHAIFEWVTLNGKLLTGIKGCWTHTVFK